MQSDDIYKKGVASVVTQLLYGDEYHEHMHKLPSIYAQLINSDDNEILREIGQCIGDKSYWNKGISRKLFKIFISSKAVTVSLYDLFKALEKLPGCLLEYQSELLQLINRITSVDSLDDVQHTHIDNSSLVNVLQRFYDEATEDEDDDAINICLDIWDKLLYSELYLAVEASRKIDSGLLN